jgi:hypothetical protein
MLPAAIGLTGAEQIEIVQNGASARASITQIAVLAALPGTTSGNPTSKVSATPVNGVASTYMRSDAAPAIDLTYSYTWTGSNTFSTGLTANGLITATQGINISGASFVANGVTITQPGNVTINAPTGGIAFSASGANGNYVSVLTGSASSGNSFGLSVRAGTTAGDAPVQILNQAGTHTFAVIAGDGSGSLGYNGSGATISFSNAGLVTLANALGINGNSPPAQSTGWGTATGGSVANNFSGSGATLAQTSAAVAELITLLKAFGLLGT